MSNKDILGFKPFRTLNYWTTNVKIIITIDELKDFLNFFGYHYEHDKYRKKNVSKKTRGVLGRVSKKRLRRLFRNDVILYRRYIKLRKKLKKK